MLASLSSLGGLFSLLLIIGTPIAFMLGIAATVTFALFMPGRLLLIPQAMYSALDGYALLSLPLFVLAAAILSVGGASRRLFDAATAVLGRLPGGLAIATILACGVFAALCGSSVATAMAIGKTAIPEMERHGYPRHFALGTVAAGGTLGILIPPSIPMIIYGVMAETSIGALFLAGIIPGIILMFVFMIVAVALCKINGYKGSVAVDFRTGLPAIVRAIPVLLLPLIILGGIYTGAFTPTEAAAVAVAYSLFLAVIVDRELAWRKIIPTFSDGMTMAAKIMFIIATAVSFGYIVTLAQIPQQTFALVNDLGLGVVGFLTVVNIILIVLGCFLESTAILLIVTPILLVSVFSLGINTIHFGILMVVNLELALITPPIGLNLFAISGVTGESLGTTIKGVWPYLMPAIAFLFFITYVPEVSLWLPRLMSR